MEDRQTKGRKRGGGNIKPRKKGRKGIPAKEKKRCSGGKEKYDPGDHKDSARKRKVP